MVVALMHPFTCMAKMAKSTHDAWARGLTS